MCGLGPITAAGHVDRTCPLNISRGRIDNAYHGATTRAASVRSLPTALCVLALLASLASALPLTPLEAGLRTETPWHLEGALAIDPGVPNVHALAFFNETSLEQKAEQGLRVVEAKSLRVTLLSWYSYPLSYVPNPEGVLSSDSPITVEDAVLDLVRIRELPQVLLDEWTHGTNHALELNAQVSRCDLWAPGRMDHEELPRDPARVPSTQAEVRRAGRDQLSAQCRASSVNAERPEVAYLYGMDFLLTSPSLDEPREYKTGTFPEEFKSVPTGRTITSVLRLEDTGQAWNFHIPSEADLRVDAHQIIALGTLTTTPSQGDLAWGPNKLKGAIDPFLAQGEFQLSGSAYQTIAVDGSTVNEPVLRKAQSEEHSLIAEMPHSLPFQAGVIVLAAFGLWQLFTRLAAHRALEHPRRAQMVDVVRNDPGIELTSLARILGIPWALASYHVSTLRRSGHLTMRRVGGRTALFPTGSAFTGRELQVALLRRRTPQRIHELLQHNSGLEQSDLAEKLGLTRARICQLLPALQSARLVESYREGRRLKYRALAAALPVSAGPR